MLKFQRGKRGSLEMARMTKFNLSGYIIVTATDQDSSLTHQDRGDWVSLIKKARFSDDITVSFPI